MNVELGQCKTNYKKMHFTTLEHILSHAIFRLIWSISWKSTTPVVFQSDFPLLNNKNIASLKLQRQR